MGTGNPGPLTNHRYATPPASSTSEVALSGRSHTHYHRSVGERHPLTQSGNACFTASRMKHGTRETPEYHWGFMSESSAGHTLTTPSICAAVRVMSS